MNLKKKSRILAVITEILTFAAITSLVIFLLMSIGYLYKLFDINLVFLPILVCLSILAAPLLSDWIFTEEFFYKHCLKATSEETLLKKGFEYMVAPLYFDFYVEAIEVDGKKINYSGDKKKFKDFLKENDKVTAFCRLKTKEHWSFHYLSDDENKASHEQLILLELPSKKILKKLKKEEKPYMVYEINTVCIRNKYAIYPNFVFFPQNIVSDPDSSKLIEQIKKDGDPITLARAILSEDVPLFSRKFPPRKRLSINTQSNYVVSRKLYTVPHEDAWNTLCFSGEGCGLVCYQEAGCKCCITSDHQKDSSDTTVEVEAFVLHPSITSDHQKDSSNTCTKILKQEQIHEVYFDDKAKNHLIDRIELVDQKLKDGFLFRNIHASKWESGYKDQILNALRSPYPLDAETAEMFEKVIEELEENLYDAKREAEDLNRECTAKALKDMLIMDGIQTNTLSENEECKGEKK